MKIKKPDIYTIIGIIYIVFMILICIIAILAVIFIIAGAFKILTSDLPFWVKWVLLIRGGK